jgi:hypothetical protein
MPVPPVDGIPPGADGGPGRESAVEEPVIMLVFARKINPGHGWTPTDDTHDEDAAAQEK